MTLTPQEQEAMAVSDRAKPYVEASRGQTIDPPSSEEIALVDLAALVRRLLEREKALVGAVKDLAEDLKLEIPGNHHSDLPCECSPCRHLAALSALNPGEIKP
jgi:hypothetical protein